MGSLAQHIQQTVAEEPAGIPGDAFTPAPDWADPRPDLTEDSELWIKLLQLACAEDPDLAETLKGFRCCGTRIRQGRGGYILRPDVDPTGGAAWASQDEYEEAKEKWLKPHVDKIAGWLQRL